MIELQPFYRGDDLVLDICVRNKATQQPMDVSGWLFDSSMKLSAELPDYPELDQQGNRQVITTTTLADGEEAKKGEVRLLFGSKQTAELLATKYRVDIQAVVSGAVQTLFYGSIAVIADVTHKGAL